MTGEPIRQRIFAVVNSIPCAYATPYDLLDPFFFLEEMVKSHVYYSCDEFLPTGEPYYAKWFERKLGKPSFAIDCSSRLIDDYSKYRNTIIRLVWDFGDYFIICKAGFRDKKTLYAGFSITCNEAYMDSPKVLDLYIKAFFLIISQNNKSENEMLTSPNERLI